MRPIIRLENTLNGGAFGQPLQWTFYRTQPPTCPSVTFIARVHPDDQRFALDCSNDLSLGYAFWRRDVSGEPI
ncbi:MAG TPA: hypothetical protein VGU90_01140, partial [Terriglobales bacterium]|nr:hypothetical protein [Terriglobales bacterium]